MLLLLHPPPAVTIAHSDLKVSCHSKLQCVSINVLGLQDEKEELPPPRYFVITRVWTFGGYWNGGGGGVVARGVSSSWAPFNPCATLKGFNLVFGTIAY